MGGRGIWIGRLGREKALVCRFLCWPDNGMALSYMYIKHAWRSRPNRTVDGPRCFLLRSRCLPAVLRSVMLLRMC